MSDKNGLPTGKHTLIEEGTEFKGSLSSNCPIVVVGKVEGDVTGPMIHVASSGVVAGKVNVKQLRSEGVLAGEVEAETVQIAGTVRDKTRIRARSLEVTLKTDKGMEVVFGECELAIGDEPDKQSAIAAALAPAESAAPATASEVKASSDTASQEAKPTDDAKPSDEAKASDDAKPGDEPKRRKHSNTQSPPP
ncbi:MAG TPA: polymer-forming cytoskeletal protein [Kofleriaceae bacterium]|nr:polymer-forming cytoskeletal protein [Kofleriaceae bacterium]